MSYKSNNKNDIDSFWDISDLVPKPARKLYSTSKSTSTVDVTFGPAEAVENQVDELKVNTVIYRVIAQDGETFQNGNQGAIEPTRQYAPKNSLVHSVKIYKTPSNYAFYEDFRRDIYKYWNREGTSCEFSDFFSYSPQYDQLNEDQLSYYFWWRENVRKDVYIKTNTCYISLYFFELINARDIISPDEAREKMIDVVVNYAALIGGMISKYVRWISDYSLLYELPAPKQNSKWLIDHATTLKEYFVIVPGNDPTGWAQAFLSYCCSYDYRTSKFANGENTALYDLHVPAALSECVKYLSGNGEILSGLMFGDCSLSLKCFDGAVCCSDLKYDMTVEYCSFSRSHELRFLIGDIVKYVENKIRAHISVKSRLTIYSLPNDLRDIIDEYFKKVLPLPRKIVKAPVKQEYDVLYDLPQNKLDLKKAMEIENSSWETTAELIDAFDKADDGEQEARDVFVVDVSMDHSCDQTEGSLADSLGNYLVGVMALAQGNNKVLRDIAHSTGKSLDNVIDSINEIAVECIGDILIEDNDGIPCIIDDYVELIK